METIKWKEAKTQLNKGLILLVFKTSWCPDCKMMEPVVAEAIKSLQTQKINIKVINIDAEEAALFKSDQEWEVLKVPSFFVIKNGKRKHIGYEYLPSELIVDAVLEHNNK